tara:strand:+ start:79 stop:471 length:393 start_codon:yes stop_codon:yes gene_type:complete
MIMRQAQPLGLRRYQAGMSHLAWLIIILALVVFGYTALKLSPHYIDHSVMKGILDRLPEGETHTSMSKDEIREYFSKRFRIENFSLKVRNVVTIDRSRKSTEVILAYEVREHLFYNLDIVVSFKDSRTFQ